MSDSTDVARILALPLTDKRQRWTGGDNTIRAYLVALFAEVWLFNADPKYGMVGDSDWRYDLYVPLCDAGLIPPWRDGYGLGYREDGTHHPEDQTLADGLIENAIRSLGAGGTGSEPAGRKMFICVFDLGSYEQQNAVVLAETADQARKLLAADIIRQRESAPRDRYGDGIDPNWTGENGFQPWFAPEKLAHVVVTEVNGPVCYTIGADE